MTVNDILDKVDDNEYIKLCSKGSGFLDTAKEINRKRHGKKEVINLKVSHWNERDGCVLEITI